MRQNDCDCAEKANQFRKDMEREMGYSHWDDAQLYMLKKCLKWFERFFSDR